MGTVWSVLQWFAQPNNVVTAALVSLAVWSWHKLRGEKASTWQEAVTGAVTSLAAEALDQWVPGGTLADGLAFVRQYVEASVWKVLAKRNIPRNSITEPIVHAAVESVTAGLANDIARKLLPAQWGALVDRVQAAAQPVKPDPTLQQLGKDIGAMMEREPDELPAAPSTTPAEK